MEEADECSSSSILTTDEGTKPPLLRHIYSLDAFGNSMLIRAAENGETPLIALLVEKFGLSINFQNYEQETALFVASMEGHDDIVDYLIMKGAGVNIPNSRDETPLHAAASNGHKGVVRILIRGGAWLQAQDIFGDTPLHFAIREEQCGTLRCLLEEGANPLVMNEDEETPSDLVKMVGSEELISTFTDTLNSSTEAGVQGVTPDALATDAMAVSAEIQFCLSMTQTVNKDFIMEQEVPSRSSLPNVGQQGPILIM